VGLNWQRRGAGATCDEEAMSKATKPPKSLARRMLDDLPVPLALWGFGVWLWSSKDEPFYLFNFGYIGTAVLLGGLVFELLPRARKHWGRKLLLLLVGVYMLGYLGLYQRENMQIEGFFFYLLGGLFAGSVIHYVAAKVVGPLLFNRGWCGWVCWTVMVTDFLPWKKPKGWLPGPWKHLRYVHFASSLGLVLSLWFIFDYRPDPHERSAELWWLIVGNALYFGLAIGLAALLRDNRAFCKYVCPIAVLMKVPARVALMRVEGKRELCNGCRACDRACPMNIRVFDYIDSGKRVLSSECTTCMSCIYACPREALALSMRRDFGCDERLDFRNTQRAEPQG